MSKSTIGGFALAVALWFPVVVASACADDGGTLYVDSPLVAPAPSSNASADPRVPRPVKPVSSEGSVVEVPPDICGEEPVNDCATAYDLGEIDGDKGSEKGSTTGFESRWYRLYVRESERHSSAGIFKKAAPGKRMRVGVSLVGPDTANYDLYYYESCDKQSQASEQPMKDTDGFTVAWGDGSTENGKNDGKVLYLKVLHRGGTCSKESKYTLHYKGNEQDNCTIDIGGYFCK